MRRLQAGLYATALAGVLALAACQGEVTEEDLQMWSHNDLGFQRLGEVVADPTQPIATRIRALEVAVEKGQAARIRTMLDGLPESAGRAEVLKGLQTELIDHLDKRDATQRDAVDALIIYKRYVGPEEFAEIQKAIGAWAFSDIDWDTPEEDVKERISSRLTSGQIGDLGPEGWRGAAVLVSRGLAVDKMVEFLTKANDPKATELLLKGLRGLHETLGVRIHHLGALAETESPAAAAYLLDIYLNNEYESDIRTSAFNSAVGMLGKPGLAKDPGPVVDRLLKVMEGGADDRWLGATHIIALEGVTRLEALLAMFKDDGDYAKTEIVPLRSLMDLCLDIKEKGHSERAVPVFMKHATNKNRVVAAISIVCLKAAQAQGARSVLQSIASAPETTPPSNLEGFLGDNYTLRGLAQNALEGLEMQKRADAEAAAGALDPFLAKQKKLIITYEVSATGEPYAQLVEARYKAFESEYKANPDAFKE